MRLFYGAFVVFSLFFVGCSDSDESGVGYAELLNANFPSFTPQYDSVSYRVEYDGVGYADATSFYNSLSNYNYSCVQPGGVHYWSCRRGDTYISFINTDETEKRGWLIMDEGSNVSTFIIDTVFPVGGKREQIRYEVEKCYTDTILQLGDYYNDLIKNRGFTSDDSGHAIKTVEGKVYEFSYEEFTSGGGVLHETGARWIVTDVDAYFRYGHKNYTPHPACGRDMIAEPD
ncbi:MAG: hypothetical protein LBQ18_06000 [Campylobacteraceae bacterium]|jgi:hypothetical protein|nr:hypothetical protein [Campylobacteraceae bacterium]